MSMENGEIKVVNKAELASILANTKINDTIVFGVERTDDFNETFDEIPPTFEDIDGFYFAKHMAISELDTEFIVIGYIGGCFVHSFPVDENSDESEVESFVSTAFSMIAEREQSDMECVFIDKDASKYSC